MCGLIGIIMSDKLPTANVAESGAASVVQGNVLVPVEWWSVPRDGMSPPTPLRQQVPAGPGAVLGHPGQPVASCAPPSQAACPSVAL